MRGTWIVIALGVAVAGAGCKKSGPAAGNGSAGSAQASGDKPKIPIPIPVNGPGSGSGATGGPLDPAAFSAALDFDALFEHVFARPEVDKAFDALMDGAFADPQLAAFGEQLMTKLGDDPGIAEGTNAIIQVIGSDQALIKRIQQLMKSKPGMGQDEIGALITQEFMQAYQLILAKPVEREIGKALETLDIDKERDHLFAVLSTSLEASATAYITDPDRMSKWTARLTELNGGTAPTPAVAATLFTQHALSEDRLAKYLVTVLGDPATRSELARFSLALGKSEDVQTALVDAVRAMVTSPEVQAAAGAALLTAMNPKVTPGVASAKVEALFAAPAIHAGLNKVVKTLLSEPTMATAIDDSLRALWAVPAIKTATDQLLDGW